MNLPFRTEAVAPDGLPLIVVGTVERDGMALYLTGSASVFEGNLILEARGVQQSQVWNVSVSAGGPERGTWAAHVELPAWAHELSIGQEEQSESVASAALRQIIVPTAGD